MDPTDTISQYPFGTRPAFTFLHSTPAVKASSLGMTSMVQESRSNTSIPQLAQLALSRKNSRASAEGDVGDLIGALDCGTTSTRFILFDEFANIVATHQVEFEQYYPEPGWHEHDPLSILETVFECIEGAVDQIEDMGYNKDIIKGMGITNQRETTLVWDRETGHPYCNAMVWDDARTAPEVRKFEKKLEEEGIEILDDDWKGGGEKLKEIEELIYEKDGKRFGRGIDVLRALTGLPLSTYFSAIKLRWMLDHYPEVKEAQSEGRLSFGTVDSWLLYNLTGGPDGQNLHYIDLTNASRTLLISLHSLTWSKALLNFFGLDESILPEIKSSSEKYGEIAAGALAGVPIAGMIGDQQAAVVGQKCLTVGEAKATYGTGAFVLFNTGEEMVKSNHGLITTIAYHPGPGSKPIYALEGSCAVAGSAIKWLRDQMHLIHKSSDIDELVGTVKDTGGVYFVTSFSGLLAPYWDSKAGGLLIGLSAYTTRAHICRATLEAASYQTRAILESMRADSGTQLTKLRVDGGVTNSDFAMQIQADLGGFTVERPEMRESTALGSAILAGSALGLFGWDVTKPETVAKVNARKVATFKPKISEKERQKKWKGWQKAVSRSMKWRDDEDEEEQEQEEEEKEGVPELK